MGTPSLARHPREETMSKTKMLVFLAVITIVTAPPPPESRGEVTIREQESRGEVTIGEQESRGEVNIGEQESCGEVTIEAPNNADAQESRIIEVLKAADRKPGCPYVLQGDLC